MKLVRDAGNTTALSLPEEKMLKSATQEKLTSSKQPGQKSKKLLLL